MVNGCFGSILRDLFSFSSYSQQKNKIIHKYEYTCSQTDFVLTQLGKQWSSVPFFGTLFTKWKRIFQK